MILDKLQIEVIVIGLSRYRFSTFVVCSFATLPFEVVAGRGSRGDAEQIAEGDGLQSLAWCSASAGNGESVLPLR